MRFLGEGELWVVGNVQREFNLGSPCFSEPFLGSLPPSFQQFVFTIRYRAEDDLEVFLPVRRSAKFPEELAGALHVLAIEAAQYHDVVRQITRANAGAF